MDIWQPRFGAVLTTDGARFRVWAPTASRVMLHLEARAGGSREIPLIRDDDNCFAAIVGDARPGDRYGYRMDEEPLWPDPASRCQPDGVHALSEIVDPSTFTWSETGWRGIAPTELIVYELHVGTFTDAGTFDAVTERLPYLRDLGVTAIELMPVAAFPGSRNWGYDGAALYAPSEQYGRPDALRRLVDRAHALGLGVILDVVYNHLGPDGAYLAAFSPLVFSTRHHSPWGRGLNFDEPGSQVLRRFFIDNALHWLVEYRIDGLRLDATHAIVDESSSPFLGQLAASVKAHVQPPRRLLIAEDSRNLDVIARPTADGGWGLDAVWADDLHHTIRGHTAGDREGYYADYKGTTAEIAETIRRGWLYRGEWSRYRNAPRGTDPTGLPWHVFITCLQNHDQIGNRAHGERLNHQVPLEVYRAASALVLLAPEVPLLFMGQEWAASTPFLFFTDHSGRLGRAVTAGRREEFRHFTAFSDPRARDRVPDPQAHDTFLRSRLQWDEVGHEPHRSTLAYYRHLLSLRRQTISESGNDRIETDAWAPDEGTVAVLRREPERVLLVVVRLSGQGTVSLSAERLARRDAGSPDPKVGPTGPWHVLLSSEDTLLSSDAQPLTVDRSPSGGLVISFQRPGALVLGKGIEGSRGRGVKGSRGQGRVGRAAG
ncbi:MAG: malto-oligosyltrehalose trehalohydrolase [Luteitalea sp.]|nr:malto-oligosyltrehalose trehalohydrolase [Luteitalea sp.]